MSWLLNAVCNVPEKIRIVSIPDLKLFVPSVALGGFGVVGREGMGVAEREMTPFSLLSFDSVTNKSSLMIDLSMRDSLLDVPSFQDMVIRVAGVREL